MPVAWSKTPRSICRSHMCSSDAFHLMVALTQQMLAFVRMCIHAAYLSCALALSAECVRNPFPPPAFPSNCSSHVGRSAVLRFVRRVRLGDEALDDMVFDAQYFARCVCAVF